MRACLIVLIAALGLEAVASLAADTPAALRDLWLRDSGRFVRSWLLLGPLPAASSQLDSNLTPTPGAAQALADGHSAYWQPSVAYHDAIDLLEVSRRSVSRGHRAAPEVVYAYATVKREQEGDAVLSVATDNAVQMWVNGKLIHEQKTDRAFEYDADKIPVRLTRGENRVLLRIARVTGPSRLALRVLEPGTLQRPLTEVAPSILPGAANELAVTTHSHKEPGPSVQVDVLAAGGKTVAGSQASRGEAVHFDTTAWRDGAYEIRFTTQTSDGNRSVSYLPWYKGDAIAAARRLFDQASTASNDATGMTLRMLADMIRDRLANKLDTAPDDAWLSIHAPLLEYEELMQASTGEAGPVHPGGFVRLAWEDDIDGSPQFCRVYLSHDYSRTRAWPTIVFLHGYNPGNPLYTNWWSVDQRHSTVADHHDVVYIEPHARGNTQYLGIGERDVLRCLQQAQQRLSIDARRIYLTGESMGGSGTWIISSRHPGLFAAVAPVFGGWDSRVAGLSGFALAARQDSTPPELFAQEVQSSFVGAEGLLNVPIFVSHGDSDQTVNVEFSRHAVRMLQRWGYDIRYEEHPGRGHESLNNADEIADWLLPHQRAESPQHVRLRSADLAGASAYWVRVEAREDPFNLIEVDAEVIHPGLIHLQTNNVARIRLSPPSALTAAQSRLQVVWNGSQRELPLAQGQGQLSLAGKAVEGGLSKRPELEGGLSRLITTPFAIVIGTSSRDPLMRQRCQEKADAFVELWKQWQHTAPRVFKDDQITAADLGRYSLLLIGGPEDNRITKRVATQLPLKVARDGFTIDGRKFAATDAVAQMIYPSPLAPDRYVSVVAATSAAGMYFWDVRLWHVSIGFPTQSWDWIIRDGRRFKLASQAQGSQRGWVAAGVFDQHWRRDDRWVYPGDPELRGNSPLRHAPAPGFTVPPQLLDSYVGDYEVAPGMRSHVTREGQQLVVRGPFGEVLHLDPESNTEFLIHNTSQLVYFVADDQGHVKGATLNDAGQELPAGRVPDHP